MQENVTSHQAQCAPSHSESFMQLTGKYLSGSDGKSPVFKAQAGTWLQCADSDVFRVSFKTSSLTFELLSIALTPGTDIQSQLSPCRTLTCSFQRRHSSLPGLPDTRYQLRLGPRPASSCGSPLAENTGIGQLSQPIHVHRFLPSW